MLDTPEGDAEAWWKTIDMNPVKPASKPAAIAVLNSSADTTAEITVPSKERPLRTQICAKHVQGH
jgi:hypothetical protein